MLKAETSKLKLPKDLQTRKLVFFRVKGDVVFFKVVVVQDFKTLKTVP